MKTRIVVYVCLFLLLLVSLVYIAKRKQAPTGFSAGRRTYTIEEEEFEPVDDRELVSHVMVVESSPDYLMLRVSLQDIDLAPVEMADGSIYTTAIDPSPCSGTFEVGKPSVPVFGNMILIPNGTQPELEIDPGERIIYEDINLMPVQPPRIALDDALIPPFTRDDEIYQVDKDCPGIFARLEPTKIMRGQEYSTIWLYPYQYNPVSKILSVYPDLTVTVRFYGELHSISPNLKSEPFELIMRRSALNWDVVSSAEDEAEEHLWEDPYPGGTYGWDYIIITHPKFIYAAKEFAKWKKQCGFKTLVTKKSNWTAAEIEKVLQNAYNSWDIKPEYVLILGDAEYVPCSYKTWHPWNDVAGENRYSYIGTDHYYTVMDGPGDYTPDILIGRLSVDTEEQAEARINGIINYEKNPPMDISFYENVASCAYFQDDANKGLAADGKTIIDISKPDNMEDFRFVQTSEDMAIFLSGPKLNKKVNRIYYAKNSVTPTYWNNGKIITTNFAGPFTNLGDTIPKYLLRSYPFSWNGNKTDVTNAVTSGCFLLTYNGHGGIDYWCSPYAPSPFYNWSDAYLWPNFQKLPVVWSIACNTGWFDNETDFKIISGAKDKTQSSKICLSEYMERPAYSVYGDCGAVGIIAATRPEYLIYSDRLFWGCIDAIWPDFIKKYGQGAGLGLGGITVDPILEMGAVLRYGKIYMDSIYNDNTEKVQFELFHWFGDPSMKIRTEKPNIMTAVFPTERPWVLHPNELIVRTDIDVIDPDDPYPKTDQIPKPKSGATVTISKANTSDYWVGKTNEYGEVIFPDLVTSDLGEYDVVVTAPNCIPFQGTLISEIGSSGGILLNVRDSEVEVKLADADLSGMEMQEVMVFTSGGDEENVTLGEEELQTGMFAGAIPTAYGDAVPGDGILQVQDGEMILTDYHDEDDGSGMSVGVHDEKMFEPERPVFEGIDYIMVDSDVVELQ